MRDQGKPTGRMSEYATPTLSAIEDLPNTLAAMLEEHRPSRMPFFGLWPLCPRSRQRSIAFSARSICSTSRPCMRPGPQSIIFPISTARRCASASSRYSLTMTGLPDGDTHHYQLTRAFLSIGANVPARRGRVRRTR